MNESIREQIIQALLDAGTALRFTELHNNTGNPSKGHFSKELQRLQQDGLVIRNEIDYKNVEYELDRKAYEKYLLSEKKTLDEKLIKTKRKTK